MQYNFDLEWFTNPKNGELVFIKPDNTRYKLIRKRDGTADWEELDEFTEWVKETRREHANQ